MSLKTTSCTTVCRICLAIDARIFPLSETPLQSVFERITSTPLHTPDKRPVVACFICFHQLKKSCKLIQMSAEAENVLTEIFKRSKKITKQSISLAHSNSKSLCRSLCISQVDNYDITLLGNVDNDSKIEVKQEMEDDHPDIRETEMCGSGNDNEVDIDGVSDTKDLKCDTYSEDPVPLRSFCVTQPHGTDVKEENPKDETSSQKTESEVQNKPEQHLIPRVSKSQPRMHKCNICQKRYLQRYHLERHLMVHTDEKPFKCKLCSAQFRHKYHMHRHLKCVHQAEITKDPYKCGKCGSKFDDKNQFRKHLKTHIYECDLCQQQIKNRPVFINHLKTHTDEKFECIICQHKCTQKSTLYSHMKKHEAEKLYEECDICKVKLNKIEMRMHSKIHKIDLECTVCQQRFKQNHQLVEHLRIHTGERPFECNHCQKRFSSKSILKSHLETHSDLKRYKCKVCGRAFKKFATLYNHKRTHNDEKRFECGLCQRKFRYKHVLNVHVRTHTGEKPFKCDVCEFRFIDRTNMLRHVSKVHDKK